MNKGDLHSSVHVQPGRGTHMGHRKKAMPVNRHRARVSMDGSSAARLDSYFPESTDEVSPDGDQQNADNAVDGGRSHLRRHIGRLSFSGYVALFLLLLVLVVSFICLQLYLPLASECNHGGINRLEPYNASPYGGREVLSDGRWAHRFVVVTDLDHNSRVVNETHRWRSFLKRGRLIVDESLRRVEVEWAPEVENHELVSQISAGGRGMELSDMVVFDGHLLTVDDRTGIIYRIVDSKKMVPWVMLNDGPGDTTKSFKAEWMSVKDQRLYVGGLGKEWTTTSGDFENYNPMWVKVVSRWGQVEHVDWTENYKRLRRAVGIEWPGYMIHESAHWSDVHRKWFFLPRRVSKEGYSEERDESQGANLMLVADALFTEPIAVKEVGGRGDGSRGFSAFQFLPHSDDKVVVALKSQERDGVPVASYLLVFNAETGEVLVNEEVMPGPYKFEGLAFV